MVAGKTIGRYEALELIGRGGMGEVFLGRDTQTGAQVAIKLLPEDLADDLEHLQRFLREAEALRMLDHPNIVKMLDFVEQDNQHILILEYVEGGSLWDLLSEEPRLPISRVLKIALEISDALARAHHLKIIHRDIKPANILLTKEGTPRLTDFGLARMTEQQSTMTKTGAVVGSYSYLSPEALENADASFSMDIWSFGVVLYEMLAGRRPFVSENPAGVLRGILMEPVPPLTDFRDDLPLGLVELVHWMLEKDRKQRIPSARRVGAELEAIITNLDSSISSTLASEAHRIRQSSRFDLRTPSAINPGNILSPDNIKTEILPRTTEFPRLQQPRRLGWRIAAVMVVLAVIIGAVIFVLAGGKDESETPSAENAAPIEPVAPGELMLLVAKLEPLGDPRESVDRFIQDDLRQVIELGAPLTRVRVREYPAVLRSTSEAQQIAAANQAAIVVWGNYTNEFIELEILLGTVDGAQLAESAMQNASTVRVRMADERQESAAPYVLADLSLWHIFRGDAISSVVAMLAMEDLNVTPAELTGVTVGAHMGRYFQNLFHDGDAAVASLDAALRLDASNPILYHYRGVALQRSGQINEARQDLDSAVRLSNGTWTPPLIVLSNIEVDSKNLQTAIDSLDNVIRLQPNDWFPYTLRGSFYYLQGDYAPASADLDQSIALKPTINFPYIVSIMLAIREGRVDDVNTLLDTVLREYPDPTFGNRIVSTFVGSTDLNFGSFYPVLLSAFSNLALGQIDAAIRDSETALSIRDDLPEIYMLQGVAYCVKEDYEAADKAYTAGIELDPDFTVLYLLRADVRSKLNNLGGSLQDFAAAQETSSWESFKPLVDTALSGGDALGCSSFFS